MRAEAIVLDLDGVLTRTAVLHERAWKETFDPLLAAEGQPAFTHEEYLRHVDGRPRADGARLLLRARGLDADDERVKAVADAKNARFRALLAAGEAEALEADVVRRWRDRGLRVAVVTSSRNAPDVLRAVGLHDVPQALVDGNVAAALRLAGKPAPDLFLEACRRLGVAPADAVAVEDAEVGVEACARAGFGLVVGLRRDGSADALLEHGADVAVGCLAEVDALLAAPREDPDWTWTYDGWDPGRQPLREALCTLGNGVIAVRGAFEEASAGGPHYPGTYLAGGYDRLATELDGEVLEHEDLVNWPNPLCLSFRVEGGRWLDLDRTDVRELHQALDLRCGVLTRRVVVRDEAGRETELESRRVVCMHDPHLIGISWRLTPRNWSGRLEIRTALDGGVRNAGVARYARLRGDHLVREASGVGEHDTLWLVVSSWQSRIRMAQVARTRVVPVPVETRSVRLDDRVERHLVVDAEQGRVVRVEKTIAVHTSRDPAATEPLREAHLTLGRAPSFAAMLRGHARAWDALWRRCDVVLEGHAEAQRILRLHVFHLLQVASPHVVGRDVGLPARGLHGEAYRGHVFWDELYVFPFLDGRIPEVTRALLAYRWRRLPAARCVAREHGARGARFPWQSGSNGREESPRLHLNPRSGRWIPDETWLQHHVNAAVAYNVWHHWRVTGDVGFLAGPGVEILVEVARFWASVARWDEALGRWRICGVVGPDEFHTRYPGASRPGIDDNAYTNVMASWCLRTAEAALRTLPATTRAEVFDALGITEAERRQWADVASRLYVPLLSNGLLAQFEGFEALEEPDWAAWRARYGDLQRLDRLLEADGDTPNRYQVSKQADVLMLFYLFSTDELRELFAGLGVPFDASRIPEHVDHYMARTCHGSTLSRVVHSWVLARADRSASWQVFLEALRSDVDDVQGGTTAEGVHLGAMAGTVDLVARGWTGAVVRDGVLWLDPRLPKELRGLSLRMRVRDAWIELRVRQEDVTVCYVDGWPEVARVGFRGTVHELRRGASLRFAVRPGSATRPRTRSLEPA